MKIVVNKNTKSISKCQNKKRSEWITNEIVQNIKIRDSFYKYMKKYPGDNHIKTLYEEYKTKVKTQIIQAKKNYYSTEILQFANDNKNVWKLYKKIMFNSDDSSKAEQINHLNYDNKRIEKKDEIADFMNGYFVNVTDTLRIENNNLNHDIINHPQRIFSNFNLTPTNLVEITSIINSLKLSAATGFDDISARFVKTFSEKLSPILVRFINHAFTTGIFPEYLKSATVIPILKNGSATNCNNYRPISVLPCFSKIFEKVIKQRLTHFLKNNNILHDEQFGFEKFSNTTAACLNLTDFITKKSDERKFVACVFLDLRKAFDCVDHEILIAKLRNLNFSNIELELFRTYLVNRTQRVRIDNVLSSMKLIKKGVPQGSILGPDLFKIYINDICKLDLHSTLLLYADDGVLKLYADTEEQLREFIIEDLSKVENWLKNHRLLLNFEKTKIMLFGSKCNTIRDNLQYFNQSIEIVEKFNYLGLVIDSKLTWNDHIEHVRKKITPYVFILKRLRNYLNDKALFTIYSSYVISNITYLNPVWSRASATSLSLIETIHKKSIKIIHGYPNRYPTNRLYCDRYISFSNICKRELYIVAYKVVNNLIKHNFILNRMIDIHSHNTRNKSCFYLTLFRTNAQKKNCLYACIKCFNDLPVELKTIENFCQFKKNITTFILNH